MISQIIQNFSTVIFLTQVTSKEAMKTQIEKWKDLGIKQDLKKGNIITVQ
jgi:hypothetical protein